MDVKVTLKLVKGVKGMLKKGIMVMHDTGPPVDPAMLRIFSFVVWVGAPLHFCVWDEAVPLPAAGELPGSLCCGWFLSNTHEGHRSMFACRNMDRRVDLSNDLLSAALMTAFCLSLFQLTGIIQGMVDGQPSLQQVLEVSRVTFSSQTLTSGPVVSSSSLSLHPPLLRIEPRNLTMITASLE